MTRLAKMRDQVDVLEWPLASSDAGWLLALVDDLAEALRAANTYVKHCERVDMEMYGGQTVKKVDAALARLAEEAP